jgi:3-dehydroquinate synthase
MRTISVELGSRSYPIHIGENLLSNSELFSQAIAAKDVMIVSNTTVAPLYLNKLAASLGDFHVHTMILPDGESYKTMSTAESIFDQLLTNKCARDTTIIALGGGVVGDIAGFSAACYQRGIRFIQTPTTLLAQVDSSVGGKTGVNHALGKNMIGAFHQPHGVIADITTLHTLAPRELYAGIAEIIKYGLIAKPDFFQWLEDNVAKLIQLDTDALTYAIEQSCLCKAEIVAQDEYEQSGMRALLNLGHTFGHAIETGMGYGEWLHGEAVGCGMLLAAEFSAALGWLTEEDITRIETLLQAANLPTAIPNSLSVDRMLELMAFDKKVKSGKLRLILLKDIGNAVLIDQFDFDLLRTVLANRIASP